MLSNHSLNEIELQQFQELGFVGPFKLIQPEDVESITEELKKVKAKAFLRRRLLSKIARIPDRQVPSFIWGKARWDKGLHAATSKVQHLSTNPTILDRVASILGEDLLLWSSHILSRKSTSNFSWHGDVEHIEWEGVTVWLALANVTQQSCMSVITRTHNLPDYTYPQELAVNRGLDCTSDRAMLEAAQQLDPKCELLSVDTKPGEFFIFAGKLWHSAKNSTPLERNAMIFQYSAPSQTVRIPLDFDPPILWKSSLPPCLLVRGKDKYGHNLVVTPPKQIQSKIHISPSPYLSSLISRQS